MLEVLRIRLEAPLMSFGGVAVDSHRPTLPLPSCSMLTGLLANAMGYDHSEPERTQALQSRVRYAVRRDRAGDVRIDYQTVDLGQPFMHDKLAWTTHGVVEARRGGSEARYGTHIRWRHFHVDASFTVALALEPAEQEPTVDDLAQALRMPERPLFLGRKTCLPSRPLLLDRVQATNLRDAVLTAPPAPRGDRRVRVWWPPGDAPVDPEKTKSFELSDLRDWRNQIHVGRRTMFETDLDRPEVRDGE